MEKRTRKVSVNLTEEQYQMLEWLATHERRSISELAALILMDNAQLLFDEKQPKGEWFIPTFVPSSKVDTIKVD